MVELLVVLAIFCIVAAFALPELWSAIYLGRTRGAAADLAGLIQQARVTAEKQNTTLGVYAGSVGSNAVGAFVNCQINATTPCTSGGNGTTWLSGDPNVAFANGVTNGAAASAPAALNPGFTTEATGTILFFSSRGLPVKSSGATYVLSKGVIFYITDTHGNWAAVSVSGAGRSKVWMWNGNGWN